MSRPLYHFYTASDFNQAVGEMTRKSGPPLEVTAGRLTVDSPGYRVRLDLVQTAYHWTQAIYCGWVVVGWACDKLSIANLDAEADAVLRGVIANLRRAGHKWKGGVICEE